mmetsp:Transcript_30500/g.94210  ORF Transcript_30500/g.94210 Transcript_30500/m.94210 type:complete len:385 (+) Transcript_30500:327-1481(+)
MLSKEPEHGQQHRGGDVGVCIRSLSEGSKRSATCGRRKRTLLACQISRLLLCVFARLVHLDKRATGPVRRRRQRLCSARARTHGEDSPGWIFRGSRGRLRKPAGAPHPEQHRRDWAHVLDNGHRGAALVLPSARGPVHAGQDVGRLFRSGLRAGANVRLDAAAEIVGNDGQGIDERPDYHAHQPVVVFERIGLDPGGERRGKALAQLFVVLPSIFDDKPIDPLEEHGHFTERVRCVGEADNGLQNERNVGFTNRSKPFAIRGKICRRRAHASRARSGVAYVHRLKRSGTHENPTRARRTPAVPRRRSRRRCGVVASGTEQRLQRGHNAEVRVRAGTGNQLGEEILENDAVGAVAEHEHGRPVIEPRFAHERQSRVAEQIDCDCR